MMMHMDVKLRELKDLLLFVYDNAQSAFYRERFQQHGFNPHKDLSSLEDIRKVPLLSRTELADADPFRLLFIPEQEVSYVSPTSGTTTGKPFFIFGSRNPMDAMTDSFRMGGEFQRILLLMPAMRATQIEAALSGQLRKTILLGDITNIPASCQLAEKLGVESVLTSPTGAMVLKDYLSPELLHSLRSLFLFGEVLTPRKKKVLSGFYPGITLFAGYALTEAGTPPLMQCPALAEREDVLFHAREDVFLFEFLDPEGTEVPLGEQGELVITSLRERATPVIRYRTGDAASFHENTCPCGRTGPLVRLYGRIDHDVVRIGGFTLRTDMLEAPLAGLQDALGDQFEAVVRERIHEGKSSIEMSLRLSLRDGVSDTPDLRRRIADSMMDDWRLSPRLILRQAIQAGLFRAPRIEFAAFPPSPKPRRVFILE